jgi:hypothetical protein
MGSLTLQTAFQIVFESTEVGEYFGNIFIQNLTSGDTIIINVSIKNPEDQQYYLAGTVTISNAQVTPVVRIGNVCGSMGMKVEAKQTAGTPRVINFEFYKK